MDEKILYKELSYTIVGCAYAVYNQIGSGYQEKYYERALCLEFQKQNITYKEQVPVDISYNNKKIGKYIADFVVNDKILVELKRTNQAPPAHKVQVLNYLQALKLKLGLLIYFTNADVRYYRIVNFHQSGNDSH